MASGASLASTRPILPGRNPDSRERARGPAAQLSRKRSQVTSCGSSRPLPWAQGAAGTSGTGLCQGTCWLRHLPALTPRGWTPRLLHTGEHPGVSLPSAGRKSGVSGGHSMVAATGWPVRWTGIAVRRSRRPGRGSGLQGAAQVRGLTPETLGAEKEGNLQSPEQHGLVSSSVPGPVHGERQRPRRPGRSETDSR